MSKIEDYEVALPKQLNCCAEFSVNSQSSDPHFAGPIQVRVEPQRIGFRWYGSREWNWADYHEVFVLLTGDTGNLFQHLLADLREKARQEGLEFGLREAEKPKEEIKPAVHYLLVPERLTKDS